MKPTQALQRALRRLPLTTKQGPHNYYKGNRTGAMGRHTKYGGYVLNYDKVRSYVVPDTTEFFLTPFVPYSVVAESARDIRTRLDREEKKRQQELKTSKATSMSSSDDSETGGIAADYEYALHKARMRDRWDGARYLLNWKSQGGELAEDQQVGPEDSTAR